MEEIVPIVLLKKKKTKKKEIFSSFWFDTEREQHWHVLLKKKHKPVGEIGLSGCPRTTSTTTCKFNKLPWYAITPNPFDCQESKTNYINKI